MDSDYSAIETIYAQRVQKFSAAEQRLASRERMVMHLRVSTFILAVTMFVLGFYSRHVLAWYLAGCVSIAGFSVLVVCHELIRRDMLRMGILRQINQQAIARLHRDWKALPKISVAVPPQHQALAADLDLFGHASLFHLICSACTPIGIRVLRDWLLEPASAAGVKRRQQAVAELAPHLELRQTLILEGRLLADRGRAIEPFVEWSERGPWLAARPWLLCLCRIMSAAAVLTLVLMSSGVIAIEIGVLAFLAILLINAFIMTLFGGKVHNIFSMANLRRNEATRYLSMFQLMYSMPHSSGESARDKKRGDEPWRGRAAAHAAAKPDCGAGHDLPLSATAAFRLSSLAVCVSVRLPHFEFVGGVAIQIRPIYARLVPGLGEIRGFVFVWQALPTTIPAGRCPKSVCRPGAFKPAGWVTRCCPARRAWTTTWRSALPVHASW